MGKVKSEKKKQLKSVTAIKKCDPSTLSKPELKIWLRHELSMAVRFRDKYTCYRCGVRCEPGIAKWNGQAAHLKPIGHCPPSAKYDPRICKWMCGGCHTTFDGNSFGGRQAAYQLDVWEKLRDSEPELYEWIKSLPRYSGEDKSTRHDLIERLNELRSINESNG